MAEKTEQPTDKKLRDARKEGNLLFSKEIVSTAILGSVIVCVFFMITYVADILYAMMTASVRLAPGHFKTVYGTVLSLTLYFIFVASFVVFVPAFLATIIANVAQIGAYFSVAKLKKGFKALDVVKNAKQIFSKQNLFSFAMNIVKCLIIGLCVYFMVVHFSYDFIKAIPCGIRCTNELYLITFLLLFIFVFFIAIPIAIIDYIFQRYFFLTNLKMSKDEVKREYKETEGNPEIKSYRKSIHQEILASSMESGIKKATVIVKNPTRYAVAIRYEGDETPMPVVLSKAEGYLARRMIQIAEREGIPVYEDVQLAQGLYRDIEAGNYITREFINPVAEVLNVIADLKRKESKKI